jgi:RNA polymerase sigma-70 factor (ECF subfamily)
MRSAAIENPIASRIEGHIPALRRFAWALTRNGEDADDLVQDCLERAINRAASFRHEGDLRAWLFTILHNSFISDRRRMKRRGLHVDIEAAADISSSGDQERSAEVRDVLAALDELPVEQREVLLLVGVEDLSYEEAARVLDIPEGTVMSRLSRARDRLRTILEEKPQERLRLVK